MASEQARELRERGIKAAKAGQKDQARQLLQQSVRLDPRNEAAWLWLTSVARDRRERIFCLKKLLETDPDNEIALKALQALGVVPERPAEPEPPLPASPPPPVVIEENGVPVPDPQRLEDLQVQVDEIVQEYLTPSVQSTFTWTHKTKRRAGERDILVLRMQVAGMILAFLIIVGLAGVIFVSNSPEAQKLLFAPTWTISPTPTSTSTPTPGFTPTPSPTLDTTNEPTYTPSPTISLSITPGDPTIQPHATELYLPVPPERDLIDAVALLNQGKVSEALPTLVNERSQTTQSFDPNPYYYEALALAESGNPKAALQRLEEAEKRLSEVSSDVARSYKPLIDVGFATVNLQLAQEAAASGNTRDERSYLTTVENRAEAAKEVDPDFAQAYVLLGRRYALERNYDNAVQILDEGLAVPKLVTNLNLIVEKGQIYYEQGEYDLAAQNAFEALYINPFSEPARLLQIHSALDEGKPGLAVIYTERYLFYFPGSTLGFKLLGDARVAEGNTDLALEAYTNALAGDKNDPAFLDALIARANLYSQQRRYDLAREDLTKALTISDKPSIRALRMQAAYNAGNYSIALNDADQLLGQDALPDAEIQLLRARVLVNQARSDDTADLEQALSLIASTSNLPPELRAVADEYRARANYELKNYDAALTAINTALSAGETGSRHYLRGQILEARAQSESNRTREQDIASAIRDYQWVVTWGQVYPYSFFQDARRRLGRLAAPPPEEPTPTSEDS